MSNLNRGGRRGFRNKPRNLNKAEPESDIDDQNPVISAFKQYSKELDAKHDRYERIVKISRDITIESKRIIFLLHTIDSKKNNGHVVLAEAQKRLQALINNNFLAIAKELDTLDVYQFIRSYSAGLQEFIEANAFYEFLSGKKLSDWETLQEKMTFEDDEELNDINCYLPEFITRCFIHPSEYMLGLADLTGEIMRRCINSLGISDIETCFLSCRVLKTFYTGYLGINMYRQKELNRKIYTLRQSLIKTENVSYNVKVRGGEAAVWGSVHDNYSTDKQEDVDEGFF